jgi:non-specific protein-tyrosine kinase
MNGPIALVQPRSRAAEAYRGLRTNLAFALPAGGLHSLLVVAPAPDAEASEVAANLAVVSAQSEKRVILVDCDLRKPSLHTHFGLQNEGGLVAALAAKAGDPLPLLTTEQPGLSLLCAGPRPANPAELLDSKAMRDLIGRLRNEADLLIFSAPPVTAVTDAAVLAPQMDGTLLVLAAGHSRRDQTSRARELLDKVGAQLLGVVLTGVEPEGSAYGSYGSESA